MSDGERRSDLTSLARGGTLNIAGTAANAVFGFALGIVVTRSLHASGAGVFFEAVALFTIASVVTTFGADVGVVRAVPRFRALGRGGDARACLPAAVAPVLLASGGVAAALFALAPQVSQLAVHGADANALVPYVRVLAPFLPLAVASKVLLAATRGYGTMLPFVAIEYVAKAGVRPLLVLAAVAAGVGEAGVALAWGLPVALGLLAALVWLRALIRGAATDDAGDARRPREVAGEFWRFASFRGFAAVFDVAVLWLDVLLVGALGSAREAGIYTAASRLVTVGAFALQAMLLVAGPQISALLAQGSRDRAQTVYQTATAWLTAVSIPLYVTVFAFAPLLLRVFGSDFVSGATALRVLALAMIVNMATGPVTVVLLMGGRSSWNLGNNLAALVVNVALNVVLIPRFGIDGAAAAWAASILVQNLAPLAQIWVAMRMHPFGPGYPVVAAAGVACYGVAGAVALYALGESVAALVVAVLAATPAYLALLFRFRELLALTELRSALRLPGLRTAVPAAVSRP
jgi:O-antigen/teichoic acid export membrane protein